MFNEEKHLYSLQINQIFDMQKLSYSVLKSIWRLNKLQPIRSLIKKLSYNSPMLVIPQNVSPIRSIPDNIEKPPYISDPSCIEKAKTGDIEIKSKQQTDRLRSACKVARKLLDYTASHLQVGMTTDDIDKLVHYKCIENKCYPSTLLYRGYPKSVCTSVNNVACHGIPDDRQLCNGDIVNIDITVYHNGYHGDVSETYIIGTTDESGFHLVNSARKCRDAGIQACKPGVLFSAIGKNISQEAEKCSVSVVPVFCGHGIGAYFHGLPDIIHFDSSHEDSLVMMEGMTFTIEPVICEGSEEVEILQDGWTAVSIDGSRSAQFEHTVLITSTGVEILTL